MEEAGQEIQFATVWSMPRGAWLVHWEDDFDHTHYLLLPFGQVPAIPPEWLRGVYCHPLDAEDAWVVQWN